MNNKPARLNKKDSIKITLTPSIKITGLILIVGLFFLAFGSIENITYLMSGV